jgi:hypothetical protein
MRLLFDNKWACCVCRNADLPIVVPQIERKRAISHT